METSHAAFIGGVEQALPHFTKDSGICSSLKDIVGDFKENNSRWTRLIQSGCRTGLEFLNSWNSMQREVQECATFLNKEGDPGPLHAAVEGAGDGREDGGTRRLIVQQRELLRAAVQLYQDTLIQRRGRLWPGQTETSYAQLGSRVC